MLPHNVSIWIIENYSDEIIKCYLDGCSVKAVAKQFRISTTSVRKILVSHGIKRRGSWKRKKQLEI